MKSIRVGQFLFFLFLVGAIDAAAQTKVVVRPIPMPNQVIHVTTTMQFAINVRVEIAGQPGNAKVVNKGLIEFTQRNRGADDQGRFEAQLTIDRLEAEDASDRTATAEDKAKRIAEAIGQTLTIFFDREGKLTDVEVPKELKQTSSLLRQLIGASFSASNFLPASEMSVGEAVAVPATIPLRVPTASPSGAYETKTAITLRSVEAAGQHRIAHLEQRTDSAATSNQPKVTGSGTIDVNLERGYVVGSATEWNVVGNYPAANQPPGAKADAMAATINVTTAAKEELK